MNNFSAIWNQNRKLAIGVFIGAWILLEIYFTIMAFTMPKAYVSTAQVKVEFSSADPDRHLIRGEAQAMLSPKVLSDVVNRLNLNERWGHRYFNDEILKTPETSEILQGRLSAKAVKNSSVISILSYNDRPEEAAEIANAVAEAYSLSRAKNQNISTAVSVQRISDAQPAHRPYKPNIPIYISIGVIVSAIYGVIAATLVIGARLLLKKLPGNRAPNSKDDHSPMPPIVSRY